MECLEDKRLAELIKDDSLNNEVAPLDDFYDAHDVYALLGLIVNPTVISAHSRPCRSILLLHR